MSELDYADWQTWPIQEQEAIRKYFMALWLDVLNARPVADGFSDIEASATCAQSVAPEKIWSPIWARGLKVI